MKTLLRFGCCYQHVFENASYLHEMLGMLQDLWSAALHFNVDV